MRMERPISSQSLMTPATFMVSADVLPISMKTDMLRPKAAMALARNMGMLMFTCDQQSSSLGVTAQAAPSPQH